MTTKTPEAPNSSDTFTAIQVVLEYQWTATRDLIAQVQAKMVPATPKPQDLDAEARPENKEEFKVPQEARSKDGETISREVTLQSVVDSLSSKGFDLEPDQRISFRDPQKSLYVYIGKASDQELIESFKLPKTAFAASSDGTPELTLLIRETGSGLSGQKPSSTVLKTQATFGAGVSIEMPQSRLFESNQGRVLLPSEVADVTKFARQTHALLGSQSFVQQPTAGSSAAHGDSAVKLDLHSATKLCRGNTMEPYPAMTSYADQADLKRTKERQIRFVVERVSLWRKLYNGVELGNGETVRYSLEDSAKLVGISKKSLDDYLLQLRFGRMYGFDFLKHQCDNIGVLRKFVREHKNKSRCKQAKQVKDESMSQPVEDVDHGMADETSRDNSCPETAAK